MKKIYALFMTLCLVLSATAAPLAGTVKGSYPLNTKVITSTKQLSLDATMQKAPAATQGMQYDATEGDLIRYYNESDALSIDTTYASEGQLSIRIVASDNSDLLSLVLFAESTVPGTIIPEGTYPITSEPAYGTAYASPGVQNGSVYPSFYGMLNSKGQILTPLYFLESGNVVVEVVDGNLKISIDAANSNNVPMTIVYEVGGKSEKVEVKGPLKYDATEGALDVTYGADAAVQLTNGDGYSILTVASPDATNEVDLAFFYDAADPETVIPADTYTIDDSYTPGTVLASTGVNNQGQVSLSFYANLDEEGYLVTPIYFLVSGTVEVTKVDGQLKVEVNAVNSNNVPIHIVYDATPAKEESAVPTNEELWEAFKPYYNEFYGLARADQPIDKVSTFAAAKMQEIMTDAKSDYKWLGDYVLNVAAGQGVNLPTDMAAANEGAWRWAVHAFFNATTGANGAAGTDFTEAGKPENWGPYYLAAQGGEEEEEETVEYSDIVMNNLKITENGTWALLEASDMMTGINVSLLVDLLNGNLLVEESAIDWNGTNLAITKAGNVTVEWSDEVNADVYNVQVVVDFMGSPMGLNLLMYGSGSAEAIEVTIEGATAEVTDNEELYLVATWDGYPVQVYLSEYYADEEYYEYEGPQVSEIQIGDDDNWLDWAVADAVAVTTEGETIVLTGAYTSYATGTTYNVTITATISTEEKPEVEYDVYEDEITNLVIDYDNMILIGGPSTNLEVDVYLGLGDYDRNTDNFALLPESSVAIRGIDATFVEGWASVDGIAQTANAVVRCVWNEMNIELHLTMSATPLEATVVVVENAVVEVEKYLLWGDMYDYALKMTGTWTDAEGLDYPVLVEVPVYYPEATEPYDMYSTVTVGGWGDDENWLGFGEGYLTITQEGNNITAAGVVENAMAGIAIDITISGTITPTGLENATVTVKPVKMIKNGQLIIEKDSVQYNINGAIVK